MQTSPTLHTAITCMQHEQRERRACDNVYTAVWQHRGCVQDWPPQDTHVIRELSAGKAPQSQAVACNKGCVRELGQDSRALRIHTPLSRCTFATKFPVRPKLDVSDLDHYTKDIVVLTVVRAPCTFPVSFNTVSSCCMPC